MRDTAALTDRLKESLTDLAEVRRIFCELGRYYDPVLGGAIMEVGHQRAIVEALVLVQQRYELRPLNG